MASCAARLTSRLSLRRCPRILRAPASRAARAWPLTCAAGVVALPDTRSATTSMPTQGSSCVGPRLDDVPKRAWLPNSPTTQERLDGRSMRHVPSGHPGRFRQVVAAASRQFPKATRRAYRSAPRPCMCFFSRLRASASTWSFQRCVVHSGLLELVVAPDSAVIRLACDDSIGPGRSRVFRPRVGTALDVDMSHLRSVVAGAVIETAMSDCAGLSGATRLMAPG
jgi:hypothetical protein